jgi:8-oxo-dGTP pyrophosphatase MutT (NUDIX family)
LQIYSLNPFGLFFVLELTINKLKQLFARGLPGEGVQLAMAPVTRLEMDFANTDFTSYRQSAVMVVLCKDDYEGWFIPLILRNSYSGIHSAQISLPGGKREALDTDLEATARRECFEEIGLINSIEVVGPLSLIYIPVSKFIVQPFLSVCEVENPLMMGQVREVKEIIKLKIDTLLDDLIMKNGLVDEKIKAPYFEVESFKIWGATAMILLEVKEILKRSM